MYDFQLQEEMLDISLELLRDVGIDAPSALGEGTALSAYYWQHRFSTDLDIFIYSSEKNVLNKIDPRNANDDIKSRLSKINYGNDLKKHPIYTEIAIDENSKMQFFTVKGFTATPYSQVRLWEKDIFIESIEEIIAKKVYYRCGDANSRDLFDIAVAIYKDPTILISINVPKEKLEKLYDSVTVIFENEQLLKIYKDDIEMMKPREEYIDIAINGIIYLKTFLESYLSGLQLNIPTMEEYCIELKEYSYNV
jgi:predicted nucleotidyltransferase component of viral defense system